MHLVKLNKQKLYMAYLKVYSWAQLHWIDGRKLSFWRRNWISLFWEILVNLDNKRLIHGVPQGSLAGPALMNWSRANYIYITADFLRLGEYSYVKW